MVWINKIRNYFMILLLKFFNSFYIYVMYVLSIYFIFIYLFIFICIKFKMFFVFHFILVSSYSNFFNLPFSTSVRWKLRTHVNVWNVPNFLHDYTTHFLFACKKLFFIICFFSHSLSTAFLSCHLTTPHIPYSFTVVACTLSCLHSVQF